MFEEQNRFPLVGVWDVFRSSLDVAAAANSAIIGNKESKIYHRPDCPGAVKVSQQNRVRFMSEAEAQAAGYRLAGNCP